MISKLRPVIAAFGLCAALPVVALDIEALSDAERDAFRAEIRAYLLDNPEVLMEAIDVLEARQADTQADADTALLAANMDALTNDEHSWVGGNPDGDITIVEFLDYRCGFCRRAFPEVEELVESDGNIRIIVKEFPILGAQSDLASRFAIAAKLTQGDEAYKTAHDALMTFRGEITPVSLAVLAEDIGLDGPAIAATMETAEVDAIIRKNFELAGKLDIRGTPTFVIGAQLVRGFVPLDGMREIVNEERG
ncbi:MAG: DsbA family protein [Pseudomonadota bacterium]